MLHGVCTAYQHGLNGIFLTPYSPHACVKYQLVFLRLDFFLQLGELKNMVFV